MTPDELDRWAAEKVMGWVKGKFTNSYGDEYSAWESKVGPFASVGIMEIDRWHPSDPHTGQIWMVVERMRELGFELRFYVPVGRKYLYSAEFIDGKEVLDANPCLAILRAAKQAVEEK